MFPTGGGDSQWVSRSAAGWLASPPLTRAPSGSAPAKMCVSLEVRVDSTDSVVSLLNSRGAVGDPPLATLRAEEVGNQSEV